MNLKSEFVIMVSKADWKKYPSLKLVTEFKSSEGGTEGGGTFLGIGNGLETISGNATGASQKQIMISVDAVTDGKPRGGKIVFTASDGETCVVELLQAGR